MSLKKYKKLNRNESVLTPKRIVGHSKICDFLDLSDGIYDYYWYGEDPSYWEPDYYDSDFEIPVYGEWIEKRGGRVQIDKRKIGSYIPEEAWLGKDGRRNKLIDSLLSGEEYKTNNTIGNITGFGGN
jgi:hypothetical protein